MFEHVHHFQQLTSCVGSNSCGVGSPVLFGATAVTSTPVAEAWLGDDKTGGLSNMATSNQGMYNSYAAISAYWTDTTAMDNLRAADITDSSVAGSTEAFSKNVDHTASSSTFNA